MLLICSHFTFGCNCASSVPLSFRSFNHFVNLFKSNKQIILDFGNEFWALVKTGNTMASNPCCCLTLKTGGFIIGILAIVLSALSLLVTSVTLTGLLVVKSIDNGTLLRNVSAEIHKNDPDINGANIDAAMSMLIILLSLALVYSILNIIMGSVLIHGIRMERSSLLKVWIIYEICALVVFLVLHISLAFVKTSDGSSHSDLLTTCLSALLQIYFIYVVYRLHDEMRGGILPTSRPKY